ncbi:MAG TPA: TonB-dependent receptor [Longimicrobiaceae bacterium]|nr:TonB-dependent receptor [Longimicrobiaceae bacterium]
MLLAGLLLLAGSPAGAQAVPAQAPGRRAAERASVAGTVVDAFSQLPLADATVVLEPRATGALPSPARSFVQATRTARTDPSGRYRFAGVAPGEYRLHVERLGYRSATVEVDLRGAAESRVSVGLDVEPVALRPVEVSVPAVEAGASYGRWSAAGGDAAGERRVAVERLRQELHLAGDVRAVTSADVAEGITLGETDLFRAMQRLPGVSARDEYSAELWTRGASWDQTRVYFDGLPLFNPVHALGVFSGINPDAVGAAFLHPGVQPAWAAGGAAGTLDIRTRRGGGGGRLSGTGELSLISGRVALDGTAGEGRQAWMVAGRRTYLDWLTRAIEGATGAEDVYVPYDFYDVTIRHDYLLAGEGAVEFSMTGGFDEVTDDIPDVLHATSGHWGTGAARLTLDTPVRGLATRHTLGASGFSSMFRQTERDTALGGSNAPEAEPSDNTIWYYTLEGRVEPATPAAARWAAGYQLVGQYVSFFGARPGPAGRLDPPRHPWDREAYLREHTGYGALWGERRWTPRAGLAVDAGLRLEAGPAVRNAGAVRLAPRVSARWRAAPQLSFSAAAGRSYQYVQAVAPAGLEAISGFHPEYLWVAAGDTAPAIVADVATLGAERRLGNRWLAAVNAYLRRSSGIAVPDPRPGSAVDRPLYVGAEGTAHGVEASARRLAGKWTASVAYSYGVSRLRAEGLRFRAPAEQRHALDATALVRLGRSWQVGAAYTAGSGIPYTRVFDGTVDCETQKPRCVWDREPRTDAPGAQLTPVFSSLDLLVDWTRDFRGWRLGGYLQLRNALNRRNAGRYTGSSECADFGARRCETHPGPVDHFEPGLPTLPVIGFRAAF